MITITEEIGGKLVRLIDTDGQTFIGYVYIITYAPDDIDANRDSITLKVGEHLICFYDNEIERINSRPKGIYHGACVGQKFSTPSRYINTAVDKQQKGAHGYAR